MGMQRELFSRVGGELRDEVRAHTMSLFDARVRARREVAVSNLDEQQFWLGTWDGALSFRLRKVRGDGSAGRINVSCLSSVHLTRHTGPFAFGAKS